MVRSIQLIYIIVIHNPGEFKRWIYPCSPSGPSGTSRRQTPSDTVLLTTQNISFKQEALLKDKVDLTTLSTALNRFDNLMSLHLEFVFTADPLCTDDLNRIITRTIVPQHGSFPCLDFTRSMEHHLEVAMQIVHLSNTKANPIRSFELNDLVQAPRSLSYSLPLPRFANCLSGVEELHVDHSQSFWTFINAESPFPALQRLRLSNLMVNLSMLENFISIQAQNLASLHLHEISLLDTRGDRPVYRFYPYEFPPQQIMLALERIARLGKLVEVAIYRAPGQIVDMSAFEMLLLGKMDVFDFTPEFIQKIRVGPDDPDLSTAAGRLEAKLRRMGFGAMMGGI